MTSDRGAQRGMTLIELMVALAVLAIMISLSVYGFQQMTTRSRESGAMRELLSVAMTARSVARSGVSPVRIQVEAVEVDGRTFNEVRWEQLACGDAWGTSCPSTQCAANACGVGGCVCPQRGDPIRFPQTVTLTGLDGLCFLGGSAAPRRRNGTTDCPADVSFVPDNDDVVIALPNMPEHRLQLEGLTGVARLVDCGQPGYCTAEAETEDPVTP